MAKVLKGTVVSTKMAKTIIVEVERVHRHPLYGKIVRRHKRFKVQNDNADIKIGDEVTIVETRPLSKLKRFKVASGK